MDGARRAMAVGSATQDHGVAGFHGQPAGVGGDVGPALVDHADDAERHLDALDGHAVRPRPGFGDPADRIGKAAHHVEAFGHRLDALVVQGQPLDHGGGQACGLAVGEILGVGGKDLGFAGTNGRRHAGERAILLRRRGKRHHPGGGLGAAPDVAHGRGDLARSVDGFQRRGHGWLLWPVLMLDPEIIRPSTMSAQASHLPPEGLTRPWPASRVPRLTPE